MCVTLGLNTRRLAPNNFNIIQTPKTFENRITRHNLALGGGGGGVLPYIRYISMCRPKVHGF